MKIHKRLLLLAAAFCALLLSSCLESHEEVWIHADGSGAARFKISMPLTPTKLHGGENGIRSKISEYLDATPAFTTYSLNTSTHEDRLHIDLAITFDNVLELREATSAEALKKLPTATTKMMGETKVEFQGLDISFSRLIDLPAAIPGASFIPSKNLQGYKLTTIIHLPKGATSHNATSTRNGNRTLIWIVPLQKAMTQPMETKFIMPLPIPWLTVSITALVILILISALIYYIFRRKAKRKITT